ncbi:MAG: DUF1824 family protein [Cyanobacteria bacterium P01_F01_bin.42]
MQTDLTETIQYLRKFELIQGRVEVDPRVKPYVIEALEQIKAESDYQIFGILTDTYEEAIATLAEFAAAFGYAVPDRPEPAEPPIYLKYNPASRLCYCNTYEGDHRGVLISFQSDFEDGLNAMFGHFPLDLYR